MKDDTFTAADLFRLVARGLVYALPIALVVALFTYIIVRRGEPVYEATTTLLAIEPNTAMQENNLSAPAIEAGTYVTVALSDPVLTEALASLTQPVFDPDRATLRTFAKNINLEVVGARNDVSHLIQITFASSTPEGAADGANAVANALQDWDRDRASAALDQRVATLEQQLAALDESIKSLRLQGDITSQQELDSRTILRNQQQEELFYARALRSATTGLLSLVQPAVLPSEPVAPSPTRDAALAAVFCIFLTYGVLLLRNVVSTRLPSIQAVKAETGLPVLAELPGGVPGRRLDRTAIGFLRTHLLFSSRHAEHQVFLITSPKEATGKAGVAASLAESFARNDQLTLLVDVDFRHPGIAALYGLKTVNHMELQAHLEHSPSSTPVTVSLEQGKQLEVIPIFAPSDTGLDTSSQKFMQCLAAWRATYDVVILHAPPLLTVSDALALAPLSTGTLLVMNLRETRRPELLEAVEQLRRVNAAISGIVVTEADARKSSTPTVGANVQKAEGKG